MKKPVKLVCSECRFETTIPKLMVDHIFETCHTLTLELCNDPEFRQIRDELEGKLALVQAFPGEVGEPVKGLTD